MEVSFFLAKLLGIYLVVMGLAALVNAERYKKMLKRADISPTEQIAYGAMGLVGGLLIILFHNVWEGWPILITLFGWLAAIKGAFALILPEHFMKLAKDMNFGSMITVYGFGSLVIGAFLLYIGYLV